jgi:hypothetical protein
MVWKIRRRDNSLPLSFVAKFIYIYGACGSVVVKEFLNISQPYRPPWSVTGIALLYGDGACFL